MDINSLSPLTLAYYGDALYEVFVRERVLKTSASLKSDALHREGVRYVNAGAQAKAIKAMLYGGFLTEEEGALLKRARNHKIATKAKNADPVDYKWATAFEALLGWLELTKQENRITEIMEEAARITEGKDPR